MRFPQTYFLQQPLGLLDSHRHARGRPLGFLVKRGNLPVRFSARLRISPGEIPKTNAIRPKVSTDGAAPPCSKVVMNDRARPLLAESSFFDNARACRNFVSSAGKARLNSSAHAPASMALDREEVSPAHWGSLFRSVTLLIFHEIRLTQPPDLINPCRFGIISFVIVPNATAMFVAKFIPLSFGIALIASLYAQDTHTNVSHETSIIGPISDGRPGEPVVAPVLPDFRVRTSIMRRMRVVEAPEMDGLPPVQGWIKATVQRVDDPRLPDPPPPLVVSAPNASAVSARLARLNPHDQATDIIFISATVYDHTRTLLRYSLSGPERGEISAWSNLDFNCFSGSSSYQVKGADGKSREHGLVMAISNEDPRTQASFLAKHHLTYKAPQIPMLPDLASGGPAFIVIPSDTDEKAGVEVIKGLHDLYRVESARMQEAYQARMKAQEERKTYLLANPAVPDDVTIRFWKRQPPTSDLKKQEGLKP